MDRSKARFAIERQDSESEWRRVACCNTLDYARAVAGAGLRRGMGVSYRAVHLASGRAIALAPALAAHAA